MYQGIDVVCILMLKLQTSCSIVTLLKTRVLIFQLPQPDDRHHLQLLSCLFQTIITSGLFQRKREMYHNSFAHSHHIHIPQTDSHMLSGWLYVYTCGLWLEKQASKRLNAAHFSPCNTKVVFIPPAGFGKSKDIHMFRGRETRRVGSITLCLPFDERVFLEITLIFSEFHHCRICPS